MPKIQRTFDKRQVTFDRIKKCRSHDRHFFIHIRSELWSVHGRDLPKQS